MNLSVNDTNEFRVASSVTVPAGATEVLVGVTNYDDLLPDGTAVVRLMAEAAGYKTGSAELLNLDNESGELFVHMPGPLEEDSGFQGSQGSVWLAEPARHDVLVRLWSEPPVEVPGSVVIRSGNLSAGFPVRVGSDAVVNPSPWTVEVQAHTAEWPEAAAVVTIKDDDDGRFSLSLPVSVLEGTTGTGVIRVNTPHQEDTQFVLSSNNPRLVVPTEVSLTAGSLSINFPVAAPDNGTLDGHFWGVQVCASTAGQPVACEKTEVIDDEVGITALTFGWTPRAVFSGQPFSFQAILGNFYQQPQYTNTTGRLELLSSPAVAQFAADPNPIQFTHGLWSNNITLTGEGLQLELQAEAAGFKATSRRFDLLEGSETSMSISDAVYSPATGMLIIAEAAQTNQPARLSEFNPRTGTRGSSVSLPRPVQRLALSQDGKVAWLASTVRTLQKVDLIDWRFLGEYPVETGNTNGMAVDLLVLPGGQDRILAITSTNRQKWQAVVYEAGVAAAGTNRATLPGGGTSSTLIQGRTPSEVFCQFFGYLNRLTVDSPAVRVDRSVNIGWSPSITLANGLLYRGTGDVFSTDTLERMEGFPVMVSTQLGLPCPERNIAVFVTVNGTFDLQAYDLASREALGAHGLPESTYEPNRLLRWGDRGFAIFSVNRRTLAVLESPLLNPGKPDLVLTTSGSDTVILPGYDNAPFYFTREFSITNRGTVQAPGVELRIASIPAYSLGTLGPGEGVTVTVTNGASGPQLVRYEASALSVLPDANAADNTLITATRVQRAALPSSKELTLGMTHLVAAPSGDRLYAAVSRGAGELQDGVAIIDPFAGTVETLLPVGTAPQRLALSGDGTQLYVLLGTNSLVRWDLTSRTQNLSLTLMEDAIIDFVPMPGSKSTFVVASRNRVAVYDDAVIRPKVHEVYNERRYIVFVAGSLWMAEPGQLIRFAVGDSGLQAEGAAVPFSLFSDWYRFTTDGRNLFFSGAVFDTVTGQRRDLFMGDQVTPDVGKSSLYTAVGKEFRNYAPETYELRSSQLVLQAGDWYLQDVVRWGEGGLAARSGTQLVMVDSPVVASAVTADLAVKVVAPVDATPYEPMEWSVILTNNSGVAAPRTSVQVDTGGLRDLTVDGPPHALSFSTLVCDLGVFPAHGSATLKLKGWNFPSTVTLSASVLTSVADPNRSDNQASASVALSQPEADLSVVSVSCPARVSEGATFEVAVVFTNSGPGAASSTLLSLPGASGLQFLGVRDNAFGTNEYGVLLGGIGPRESRTVTLVYKALAPGLTPVVTSAGGSVTDPRRENDRRSGWTFIVPADPNQAVVEMSSQGPILAWDRSRQQVLAAFPNKSWDLFVLNPWTMEPVSSLSLPGLPEFIAPCNNGKHVWVSMAGGWATRIDLDAMSIDQQFVYADVSGPVWAVATPPGKSNILVVATDPGWLGNNRLLLFENGVRLPGEYAPLGWAGGGVSLLFNSEGRFFLSCSQMLRELRLTPTGFEEVRNFDSAARYDSVSLSYAASRLFYYLGRWVDPATGAFDDSLFPAYPLAADEQTSLLYTATGSRILWGGPPMTIQCLDAQTLASRWRAVPELPASEVGGILPMGTNGCLVVGSSMWHVRPALFGPPAADLVLTVSNAPATAEIGIPVRVQVNLTNRSVWTASDASLRVEFGPGLAFTEQPPGPTGTISLGDLNGSTNLSVWALPTAPGTTTVGLQATSRLPAPEPAAGQATVHLTTLPPPVFQLDNTTIPEGGSYSATPLVAQISRPASTNLSASFSVTPLASRPEDFRLLSGTFEFAPGESRALASIIQGNSTPESNKTALLTFSSTNLALARNNAVLTIVNDDFPTVSVTNVTLSEGNAASTNATFRFSLSSKAPFPVAVQFLMLPGTASPGTDYIPRQGRVQFPANTDSQSISVPILGDTMFEPAETASVVLLSATEAVIPSASALLTIKNDDSPPIPVLNLVHADPAALQFQFISEPGANYQLQTKTNLASGGWISTGSQVTGNGERPPSPSRAPLQKTAFYRLRAW